MGAIHNIDCNQDNFKHVVISYYNNDIRDNIKQVSRTSIERGY